MSRSTIVCHSPADICFGCAHYQDPVSSPVCEYAGTYLVEMLRQGTGTTAMEYPEYRKAATRAADRLEQLEAEVARLREDVLRWFAYIDPFELVDDDRKHFERWREEQALATMRETKEETK